MSIDSAVFIFAALSIFHPANRRDRKAMGALSAFIVALFIDMYGFHLTVYLPTSCFGNPLPDILRLPARPAAMADTSAEAQVFSRDRGRWRCLSCGNPTTDQQRNRRP